MVRSLIDAGLMGPVVLVEPVQTGSDPGSSTTLYSPARFDPATHMAMLKSKLDARGIRIASLSYIGHSGAGATRTTGCTSSSQSTRA